MTTEAQMAKPGARSLEEAATLLRRVLNTNVAIAASARDALGDDATVRTFQSAESVLTVRNGVRRIVVSVGVSGAALVCEWPSGSVISQSTLDVLRLVEVLTTSTHEEEPSQRGGAADSVCDEFRLEELQGLADQTITAGHHTFALEHALEDLIEAGDRAGLAAFLQHHPIDLTMGQLSSRDALRSQKDVAICLITVATRSASAGGLTVESAFSLSDSYIRRLEDCLSASDVVALIRLALLDLAKKVADVRATAHPSIVRRAVSYIEHNLAGDLSTAAIAQHVGVRPHYLGQLFKAELGQSLGQYAALSRVKAAKQMLVSTDLRLIDICGRLGFYDQSHFTRVFKRATGTTPRRFREVNAQRTRNTTGRAAVAA